MELVLIRHGQTRANAEGRYLGSLDLPLDITGLAQMWELAEELANDLPFDRLLCSPLLRARQSAELLGERLGLVPHIMPAFRERYVGCFEGLTQGEAAARYPDLWALNITRRWHLAPPGGEPLGAMAARLGAALESLSQEQQATRILLVAHGVVGRMCRALLEEGFSNFFERQLGNGDRIALTLTPGIMLHSWPVSD
ncbi:probable phosphoglycerate mutase [Aeromonas sp. RU39B]|uniref:histidine phosphatase family protein n=1 Tax=Aeromonas sp. RU39B TaxID=1907416 RepID=UPI00095452E3|nr:histidine phosphatase family protein [Aeromonas sp. RU39B]SIR41566.1 probable phosphoglycerate mutase [Aeromonas sp. RU39B]